MSARHGVADTEEFGQREGVAATKEFRQKESVAATKKFRKRARMCFKTAYLSKKSSYQWLKTQDLNFCTPT